MGDDVAILPTHSLSKKRDTVRLGRRQIAKPLFLFVVLCIGANFFFLSSPRSPLAIGESPILLEEPKESQPPPTPPTPDPVWSERAASVKEAFLHAYGGYERGTTFPDDELRPVSNTSARNFNGWGVTVVDSLDTMWLMGLTSHFNKAVKQVATLNFSMNHNDHAPFFETVIRYLGGLLSAHALSGEPILLDRATDLAKKLLPVFDTPSGLPRYAVNTETGDAKDDSSRVGHILLAEAASFQVEYRYLAHVTKEASFFQKAEKVTSLMHEGQLTNGLWNTVWDIDTGKQVNDHVGVAAWADSAYEYVLKQYLLSGKSEKRLREMYLKSMSGVIRNLLFLSPTRNLLYVSDIENKYLTGKFEHLSCFLPGLLALGASALDLPESERELHMWAAEGLAHSCYIMYADQASGLGPELVVMNHSAVDWKNERWILQVEEWQRSGRSGGKPPGVGKLAPPANPGETLDYYIQVGTYLSRPETLESMFIMWRTTKNPMWREYGWAIWKAIEEKTRTPSGYASVQGVNQANPWKLDSMPSYFLSETVKYAYLLAIDEDPWPADNFVFNTEAHPLPIFGRRNKQR